MKEIWAIFISRYRTMGRRDKLLSSRVMPSQPGSTNPAVEWMTSPKRPRELLPCQLGDQLDMLLRAAQDELAGVQDEGLFPGYGNGLGRLLPALPEVHGELPGRVESQDLAVQMQVNAGRLELRRVERTDDQPALFQGFQDGAVAEQHRIMFPCLGG